jgi:hypothetical protein
VAGVETACATGVPADVLFYGGRAVGPWAPVPGAPGVFSKITACGRGAEYVKAAKAAGEKVDCAAPAAGAAKH